jgi:2-dehydro-3-deoxyglucarate aldolase
MNHEFCNQLRSERRLFGTMLTLDSVAAMEVVAGCGLDWIFVESEHAPMTSQGLERVLVAAGNTPCLVRLPNHEPIWIKRALDLGAAGIIVPQVNTVDEARAIVQASRFTPLGERGVGVCRANNYGYAVGETIENSNAATAVLVQAEHIDCLDNVQAIAEIDGIDGIFVGPYDLSASMGRPGDLSHPDVAAAIEQIRNSCAAAGKPTGYFGVNIDDTRARIAQGFTLVACSVDVVMLRNSVSALAAALRES